jgi:hypothetical protein
VVDVEELKEVLALLLVHAEVDGQHHGFQVLECDYATLVRELLIEGVQAE